MGWAETRVKQLQDEEANRLAAEGKIEEVKEDKVIDFDDLKKDELIALLENSGIVVSSVLKKDELIRMVKELFEE